MEVIRGRNGMGWDGMGWNGIEGLLFDRVREVRGIEEMEKVRRWEKGGDGEREDWTTYLTLPYLTLLHSVPVCSSIIWCALN